MLLRDLYGMAAHSVASHPLRSLLTAGGIAVGIAAVTLLTTLGQGVQRYVLAEFTQFGTHLIAVNPGKTETVGMMGGILATVRPLTFADAEALARLPEVQAVVPGIYGNGRVSAGRRARSTYVNGVNHNMPEVWRFQVRAGRFLPPDDDAAARALAVLGSRLKTELFGAESALGRTIRVGERRFRVVGVMAPKGQVLGFDMDDAVYIPAAQALALFNREGLMEVDLLYRAGGDEARLVEAIKRTLTARHGREDFTIVTQNQMIDVLGRILGVLTFAVAALGGISLLVGAVGIVTIMSIAVGERVGEIGLLRALGATRGRVMALFLGEAVLLALGGALIGLAAGIGGARLIGALVPALPVRTPWGYALLALAVSMLIGLAAGVFPARRAARLDPVEALRAE
ncbi:MAG: ABC transporter permease [Nitrospirae bacterium]|nr:ABC transporter permease [Nitrospirota bacterium]